nr:MAG TPA: hypothetical protein [Caudoviricetes sp.]
MNVGKFTFPDDEDFWEIFDRMSDDEDIGKSELEYLIFSLIKANYDNISDEEKQKIQFTRHKNKLIKCVSEFYNSLENIFENFEIKNNKYTRWFDKNGSSIIKSYDFNFNDLVFLKRKLYDQLIEKTQGSINGEDDFIFLNDGTALVKKDVPLSNLSLLEDNVMNYFNELKMEIRNQKFIKHVNTSVYNMYDYRGILNYTQSNNSDYLEHYKRMGEEKELKEHNLI